MIIRHIKEGENLPFGYAPIGISLSRLGYDVALFPFNILIKRWRNYLSQFKTEEWENRLIKEIHTKLGESYERGIAKGIEKHQNDMNRRFLEISALLEQKRNL